MKRVKVKGHNRSKVKVTINVNEKRVGSGQRQVALFADFIRFRHKWHVKN